MRRLAVCDSHDASWMKAAAAESRDGDRWDILLLGVSAVAFEREHRAALAALDGARLLDVGALASDVTAEVSRYAIDLVDRLPAFDAGGQTVAERLREGDHNLWWSLEISEKSSFRGLLLERLYRLALVAEALREGAYDGLWLHVSDSGLADTIAAGSGLPTVRPPGPDSARHRGFAADYWLKAGAALARFVAVRAVIALTGWNGRTVAPGSLGIFTLFPYWWIAPFGGRPVDRFFSAPPHDTAPHYIAWVTWPGRVWRERKALKRTLAQMRIVPLQRFVRWGDVIRMLSPGRFRRLARARDAVRSHLRVSFRTFDVSSLVADDLVASMSDAELFFDHLVYSGLRRYLDAARPGVVAYRVEGQAWEHALLGAAHDAGTPAVGFFHSMYGENYAALRFAPGELAGADRGAGPRPVPGRMLVSGSTVEGYLVRDGYEPAAIARCGPQRHAPFVEFLRTRPSRAALRAQLSLPADVPVYFVAIAIVEVETEGLFACLEQALAGQDALHLLIKTHPNRPAGDASMRAAVRSIGAERITYVPPGADMYEYLAASDSMICIGSTVAFEAMALDVMPVVYEHPGTLAVTSLRAFDDALYVVNSPASLRAALEEVRQDAAGARRRRERWPATLSGVLGDLRAPLDEQMQRALAQLGVAPLQSN